MIDHYRTFGAYMPEDRRAEVHGHYEVRSREQGAVLFADLVGFTGLTSHLREVYGERRGAEEVLVHLNRVYDAVIGTASVYGGVVVGFAGDAITCWFGGDDGDRVAYRTAYCGLAMQRAMHQFEELSLPGGETISLGLKVAVTTGTVRRFVVGDPSIQLIDVIAGGPVAQIESLEAAMLKGMVVVSPRAAKAIGRSAPLMGAEGGEHGPAYMPPTYVEQLDLAPPPFDGVDVSKAGPEQLAPWLLPAIRRRLAAGGGHFLTELRPVAALFLSFGGIDLDNDDDAPRKFGAVVQAAQQVAQLFGGNVLQVTSGDKGNYLYMTFGAPVSHEDDVKRSASAALDLRHELLQLEFLTHVSIGLGYGTARTGAYGSESRRTYGALGEGTNMAARMMSAAPHTRIYVSGEFAAAVGNGFSLTPLEGLKVKGRAEPVRAFELLERTADAAHMQPGRMTKLHGREEELELLRRAVAAATRGEGQVVQLVADAGMGKTELLRHALADEGGSLRVVRGACQAFGRTAPYQLWKSVFQQLLGVNESLSAAERMTGVERALAAIDEALVPQAQLLAPVLGLPLVAEPEHDAEERDSARRRLLLTLFRHAARTSFAGGRTLVLVLEDLHWLDPASEDLLKAVGQAAMAVPVLLLTSTRPAEVAAGLPHGALERATTVELRPLNPDAAREVVAARLTEAQVTGGEAGGQTPGGQVETPMLGGQLGALTTAIVRRAGGNPFYLQELVTDVLQRAQQQGSAANLTGELPSNLHSLILGRLDRLHDEQLVSLKVASIVGREFQTAWVAACQKGASTPAEEAARGANPNRPGSAQPTVVTERAAEAAFQATGEAGLTNRLSLQPSSHEFNHAITHEVAYGSQAHADRTRLHTVLARFVENEVATADAPHLDLLAYHYSLGEDAEKARYFLAAAGSAAKAAYANHAALDYFGRLLVLLQGEERLPTLLELGEVASFVGAYADADKYLREALDLAVATSGTASRAVALRLLGELHERQGDHKGARTPLEEAARLCRERAHELTSSAELTRVLLALGGNVLWHLGEYDAAEVQLDEAVQLTRASGDVRAAARALHGKANIHLYRGQFEAAEAAFSESLGMRRAANDEYGVAQALNNLAIVHANAGAGARAEELFAESLAIRQRLGDVSGAAVALNNLGYMAAERGDLEMARRLYQESLAARRELGDRLGLAVSLNNLAGLVLGLGQVEEARQRYLESVRLACSIDNRREAAAALAGLANAVQDDAVGARMAWVAEGLLEQLGAAVDDEVRAHIDKGKARNPGATLPGVQPSVTLEEAVERALQGA